MSRRWQHNGLWARITGASRMGWNWGRLALIGVFAASVCLARPASADEATTAQALFDAGADARDQGDFATACEKFEASNQLDPAPGTLLNIADCREQLGQLAQSWQRYTEAADRLPQSDPRAAYAKKKADELSPRLPRVLAKWREVPQQAQAVVYLDGTVLPSSALDVALPVDPGKHEYVVKADGHEDFSTTIDATEAESVEVLLALGPPIAAAPAPTAADTSDPDEPGTDKNSKVMRTAGWVGVGVGGAGLVLGAVSGILAIAASETVKEDCDLEADFCRTEDGKKAADAGNVLATMSTASFIAGGVFAAAGVTLVILGNRRASKMGQETSTLRDSMTLSVQSTSRMTGLSLKGAF